jgi:hypothetical protein
MDIYGSGAATEVDENVGLVRAGFLFSETEGLNIIGDGFTNDPVASGASRWEMEGTMGIGVPAWGARRGDFALYSSATFQRFSSSSPTWTQQGEQSMRIAIPGTTQTTRIFHIAFSIDTLPAVEGHQGMICSFQDSAGEIRGYLGVNPSGRLILYAADWVSGTTALTGPTQLAVSGSPVIQAQTWYSINIKVVTNASATTADVDVYVGDISASNLAIDANGVALTDTGNNNIDILGLLPPSMSIEGNDDYPVDVSTRWVRDIVICDANGTYNNDLLGQVFVAAQEMRNEDEGGGWTAQPRENLGSGILDHVDASTGVRIADNTAFELGAGAFTLEGFFRFDAIPTTNEYILFSKWDETGNDREYKLSFNSSNDTLRWTITTDGTTETIIQQYPVDIDFRKWYHIAVCREVVSGVGTTRMFLNGTQIGVDRTDNNTYHAGSAPFGIASSWDVVSGVPTLDTDNVFVGYVDEVRLTKGVARYTTDFATPTAQFGRDAIDDTDFASVSLLAGFDGAIIDESNNAFTLTAGSGVAAEQPDDGDFSYSVLNQRIAWDDTYIEAVNTRASAILTLTANPTAGETVTVGSKTYTFRTTFSSNPVNEVDIGADTEATLQNLLAAINAGAGAGTAYGTGTTANADAIASSVFDPQLFIDAATLGASGNSIASTETLANGAFENGATFTGGADISGASDFAVERLPLDVTGILGVQVTGRGYKSDAGSASLRFDLVGPSAGVDTGDALATDLNPAWLRQVFEEDPDTAAGITPSTITGGRIRVNRTA